MRERVREAAATAILEAAEQVAAERGLEATSTALIAERAGVAVGTLYNYFPDREALIAALFKHRREELVPRMIAAAEAAKALPFEDRLRTFIVSIAREFDRVRLFCRVAMSAEGQIKVRKSSAVLPIVTAALTEMLRPVVRDRAAEHAVMIFGGLKAMMQARLERDEPLEPAAHMLVDTILGGLQRR
jgi:AcrR family transcriptional regulator